MVLLALTSQAGLFARLASADIGCPVAKPVTERFELHLH